MKTETSELIEEPPSWHCRVRIGPVSFKRNEAGVRRVKAELVYGHSKPDENHIPVITGSVHFKLTGSTAEVSISEMAHSLNARKAVPNDEVDECFADRAGWEKASADNFQTIAIPLPPQEQDELSGI